MPQSKVAQPIRGRRLNGELRWSRVRFRGSCGPGLRRRETPRVRASEAAGSGICTGSRRRNHARTSRGRHGCWHHGPRRRAWSRPSGDLLRGRVVVRSRHRGRVEQGAWSWLSLWSGPNGIPTAVPTMGRRPACLHTLPVWVSVRNMVGFRSRKRSGYVIPIKVRIGQIGPFPIKKDTASPGAIRETVLLPEHRANPGTVNHADAAPAGRAKVPPCLQAASR